jgi:hypothetical protein
MKPALHLVDNEIESQLRAVRLHFIWYVFSGPPFEYRCSSLKHAKSVTYHLLLAFFFSVAFDAKQHPNMQHFFCHEQL